MPQVIQVTGELVETFDDLTPDNDLVCEHDRLCLQAATPNNNMGC